MELRTTTRRVGEHAVVALDGAADLAGAPVLHDLLRRAVIDHPGETVVVDLDGASVVDDVALGLLLGAAATAREHGGELVVVCTTPSITRRLAVTRFDRAVTVRDSIV